MTVLITKQNIPFFQSILPKRKYTDSTKNTCTFQISLKKFEELKTKLRELKQNPYTVMHW